MHRPEIVFGADVTHAADKHTDYAGWIAARSHDGPDATVSIRTWGGYRHSPIRDVRLARRVHVAAATATDRQSAPHARSVITWPHPNEHCDAGMWTFTALNVLDASRYAHRLLEEHATRTEPAR